MIDLFRFISLRPPALPASTQTIPITPSATLQRELGHSLDPGVPAARVTALARELLAGGRGLADSPDKLAYAGNYASFISALDAPPAEPPTPVRGLILQNFGHDAGTVAASAGFASDKAVAGDTLILVKLASDGTGIDVAGLSAALRAIAIIENVAAGVTAPAMNPVFVLAALPLTRAVNQPSAQQAAAAPPAPAAVAAPPAPAAVAAPPAQPPPVQDLARAIQALTSLPASSLQVTDLPAAGSTQTSPGAGAKTPSASRRTAAKRAGADSAPAAVPAPDALPAARSSARQVLAIPPALASTLDPAVARVAERLHLDLSRTPVPALVAAMSDAMTQAARSIPVQGAQPVLQDQGAGNQTGPGGDPGTGPLPPLPTQPGGVVSPIGIGDLLVVKQRPLRYEGGDVAHIENVLRTEAFKRDTKRIDLTQTTVTTETDITTEQEQDTQSTDRFALQRETANTLQQDSSLKAGVSVSASYGPTVSVKANLDSATSSSQTDATKQSTSFSKDVTSRAASSITQTTKQIQTMLTSNSFEEDLSHGFDNTNGPDNISGVYQWVNKVYEAQVYNYGIRLMFDVMVPEPAAFLISQLASQPSTTPLPPNPPPFTTLPQQINDTPGDPNNYQALAAPYGTINLDPPPDVYLTVPGKYGLDGLDPSKAAIKVDELSITAEYQAYSVDVGFDFGTASLNSALMVTVGTAELGISNPSNMTLQQAKPMNNEVGSVPMSLVARGMDAYTVAIEIKCKRTDRAYEIWQEKVHAAIMQDYQRLLATYQNAVSAAASTASTIQGHNPLLNTELQQNELKKACITLMTGQQYEAFGAVELSNPDLFPEVLLGNVTAQGKYARFLEEAFEWDQMTYFYYPYYWGRKGRWPLHVLATDPDPQFSDFLNAGYARVVFPVRPNYEPDVAHLLETGLVYDGGDIPPIQSPLYVSVITEIQQQEGAPGDETPQGPAWEVTLPTTLVKLRKDDQLPTWGWDASTPPQWVELNPE